MHPRGTVALALLFAGACASTPKQPEPVGPVRDPDQVRAIEPGMAKPKAYRVVGPVKVEISAQNATRRDLLLELRRAAGLLGADAVIVEGIDLKGQAAQDTNAILLTDIRSSARGTAILLSGR